MDEKKQCKLCEYGGDWKPAHHPHLPLRGLCKYPLDKVLEQIPSHFTPIRHFVKGLPPTVQEDWGWDCPTFLPKTNGKPKFQRTKKKFKRTK
jgi:hypothetical protein